MQVEKNGIKKNISANLLKDYQDAGWKLIKETKKEVKAKENKEIELTNGE